MLTVCCVLRSGGDYGPHHVAALQQGVTSHLSIEHRFVCLSDVDVPCERIPLRHKWQGWWAKVELFRPALFWGPVLYLDLDTIIVGSLDEIVLGHRFTVLRSFWSAKYKEPQRIGSGVMAWNADLSDLYRIFASSPEMFIRKYRTKARWGDQGFIKDYSPIEPERWQDKHPGKVLSFKQHIVKLGHVPPESAVIAFHGRPRPWAITPAQRRMLTRVKEAA